MPFQGDSRFTRPFSQGDALGWRIAPLRGTRERGRRRSGRYDSAGVMPMSCQTHLYRGHDPKLLARRWFFQQCGVGLGAVALMDLLRQNGAAAEVVPDPPG